MTSISLAGKRILITGAARGLGRGFAEAAAEAGARLVLADILDDAGRETARAIAAQGAEAHFRPVDLGDPDQIAALAGAVERDLAPTAQHALREGKVLGYNVAASIRGRPLKTFRYKTRGSMAALGHQLAVAEVLGYRFSGFLAWLMWRAFYLSKLPTLEKQARVGLDWLLDIFFAPDIVQTIDFSRSTLTGSPDEDTRRERRKRIRSRSGGDQTRVPSPRDRSRRIDPRLE